MYGTRSVALSGETEGGCGYGIRWCMEVVSSSDVSDTTTRSGKREAEAAELDRGAAEAAELDRGAAELDRKASAGGRAS
jgi:hypothetical protein